MLALGQPVHTFDYDKIVGHSMTLRESKKGEKITTLDKKIFTLAGGDIVIEDGEGRLIDLAGVMGGNLSAVDENTKNVLLFVQTYDPVRIRKTSMGLAQRTNAATIFEKGTDPELVSAGILEGINLFQKYSGGDVENEILDIYPFPYKPKAVTTSIEFIESRLGISISKKFISEILNSLEFESVWSGNALKITPPSFRAQDIQIEEDVVEEIARLYGYYNLPSLLMNGVLPESSDLSKLFTFETNVKNILSGWGGVEVYTCLWFQKNTQKDFRLS
jgi:phenylalanyl-tRNA synthetase beta chain